MAARTDRAARFADALLTLAQAEDAVPQTEQDLLAVRDLISKQPRLLGFLRDPSVTDAGKRAALDELLANRIGPVTLGFMDLLLRLGALDTFDAVSETFLSAAAAADSKASGLVVSAVPLPDETVTRLEDAIGKAIGREVHLLVKIDTELLGGIKVVVGDYVVDGTIDTYLEQARLALLA